jgi:hypothetical protein
LFLYLLELFDLHLEVKDSADELHDRCDELFLDVHCEGINLNCDVLEEVDVKHLRILDDHNIHEMLVIKVLLVLLGSEDNWVINEELRVIVYVDVLNTHLSGLAEFST